MSPIRLLFAAIVAGCAAVMGFAYYLQYSDGLMPCTLCMMQRGAYVLVGFMALLGLLIPYRRNGFRVCAFFGLLFAAGGAGLAARQVWLQHQPLDPNAPCVPGLGYLFKVFPFSRALSMALQGTTDCGQVNWTFLSLSMAEWSLICFIGMALILLLLMCWMPRLKR